MDRIIRISLGLFMIIFVVFVSAVSFQVFAEKAYLSSLSSTYSYSCTITTDSPLSNVTLFLPVPADPSGNSPIVAQFSAQNITGFPEDWTVTLYDTGKSTLVQITTPAIIPPPGTTPEKPYRFLLSSDMKSDTIIDTREPIKNSAVFRPVREIRQVSCPQGSPEQGTPLCFHYLTSLYADYQAPGNATVTITSNVTGKNSWKIFEPRSNEYNTSVSMQLSGNTHHGWSTMKGTLTSNTGMYDAPIIRT